MQIRYRDLERICPATSYRDISFEDGVWVDVPDDIAAALEGNPFFERAIEAESVEVAAQPENITDLDEAPVEPRRPGRPRRTV